MNNITISLVAIAVITLSILTLLRKLSPGKRPEITVQGTLEKIREVGDLCVLKAFVKEIVTLKTEDGWHTTDGKMALICSFEIEFRYDLKKVVIEAVGQASAYRLTLPPHFCKVVPDKIEFYHEEKPKLLAIYAKDFTVEQRNNMISRARTAATLQAQVLHESIESKVQASAEATLRAIAGAFGAKQIEFRFGKTDSSFEQIRDGMQRLAA